MRAIAVDDEQIGLSRMLRLLKECDCFSYMKGYNNPEEALENVETDNSDIAFLDIEMPEMNGLVLAERLMEQNPHMEVVFITAYDKYAIQAFEINAIGYLLKPVELSKLRDKMEYILSKNKKQETVNTCKVLYVQTFENYLVCFDEEMKNCINFRTEKARELFGYLLNYQGRPVARDKIVEAIWPDMEWEKAIKIFHTTCYYIRKNLGLDNIVLRNQSGYQLKENCIVSDRNFLNQAIQEINKENPNLELILPAFYKYHGAYFENEDYLWALEEKRIYEENFEKIGLFLVSYYENNKQYIAIENILEHLLKVLPFSDVACAKLIRFNVEKGNKRNAQKIFEKFQNNFEDEWNEEILGSLKKLLI